MQTISRGAPFYNSGDVAGCAALYESLAESLVAGRSLPELHTALFSDVISSSSPTVDARAWAFRRVFDRALADFQFTPLVEAPLPAGFPPPGKVGCVTKKEYPAYRCATDPAGQFGALFRHISTRSIAMTAPVISSLSSPEMSFLYASTAFGSQGSDGRVLVQDHPPATVLSIGIRGSTDGLPLAMRVLEGALEGGKYVRMGSPRVLGYNSPMVPQERKYWELQIPISVAANL
jgi:hypothetical protein